MGESKWTTAKWREKDGFSVENLREVREDLGITMVWLGHLCGISPSSMSYIERFPQRYRLSKKGMTDLLGALRSYDKDVYLEDLLNLRDAKEFRDNWSSEREPRPTSDKQPASRVALDNQFDVSEATDAGSARIPAQTPEGDYSDTKRIGVLYELKNVLESRGITRKDLFEATGLSRRTIEDIITGARGTTQGKAELIARYIGVPVTVLKGEGVEEEYGDAPMELTSDVVDEGVPVTDPSDLDEEDIETFTKRAVREAVSLAVAAVIQDMGESLIKRSEDISSQIDPSLGSKR